MVFGRYWIIFLLLFFWGLPVLAQDPCDLPPDYALTRPNPGAGPTQVKVSLFIDNLLKINDIARTFTVDFYTKIQWEDPRLATTASRSETKICRFPLEEVWYPVVLVANQAELRKQYKQWARVESNGEVTYTQRYNGTIASPFNLKRFPFDKQSLNIALASFFPTEIVQFELGDSSGQVPTLFLDSWDIGAGQTRLEKQYVQFDKQNHSKFLYEIKVERKQGFYRWKVFLPLILIVLMSWTVFYISPQFRVVQISLASTSFLTLVAFQIRLAVMIPQVDYLTLIGKFSNWCLLLVFLALLETVYVSVQAGMDREVLAKKVDRISRILIPIIFIGGSLLIYYV